MRVTHKRKIRKSTRFFYILIAIALLFVSLASFLSILFSDNSYNDKEEVYAYDAKFNSTYVVNLIDNEFISEKTLPMYQAYVTDLIDNIEMNFNYSLDTSKDTEVKYTYKIKGVLEGFYTKERKRSKSIKPRIHLIRGKDTNN